jgi:hypothetical protein
MSVIWEDPPVASDRAERFGREPSPLRKEADAMLDTLRQHEGRWARLWDLETKEEARKRSNYAGMKGFSFSVRETAHGWSVFGKYKGEPEPTPEPASAPAPQPVSEPSSEPVREPTFQE